MEILSIFFGIFGLFFIITNGIIFYYRFFKKGTISYAPVLGGVSLMIALFLYEPLRYYCWIALFLDFSIIEILYWGIKFIFKKRK